MAIVSFRSSWTAAVFDGRRAPPFQAFRSVLERKLVILHAATDLHDLRCPPSNHLEKLKRDRLGQHSIRVNDQFRLCFVWSKEGPSEVECVDYH